MKRYVIFGAGALGRLLVSKLSKKGIVIGFVDNNQSLWNKNINGIKVLGKPEILKDLNFDFVTIASTMHFYEMREELRELNINTNKVDFETYENLLLEIQSRVNFLYRFAQENKRIPNKFSIAEGGYTKECFLGK